MQAEINDDVLGLLKQDPSMPEYYRSNANFSPTELIEITLDTQYVKDEDFPAVLELAHNTYSALAGKTDILLQAVVDELLPTPEHGWAADLITEEEFLAQIKLEAIELLQDGSANVYYRPEELEEFFGDHIINVKLNPDHSVKLIKLQ